MDSTPDLKDLIKNKEVFFNFYRAGELYYITEDGFEFVVPISDTGDGVFLGRDKAIYFMRYIRKQLEANEAGLADSY